MKLILKVTNSSEHRMNNEYDLNQSATLEEHLDNWEHGMDASNISGELVIGYYTFREKDLQSGTFHEIMRRKVVKV